MYSEFDTLCFDGLHHNWTCGSMFMCCFTSGIPLVFSFTCIDMFLVKGCKYLCPCLAYTAFEEGGVDDATFVTGIWFIWSHPQSYPIMPPNTSHKMTHT
jgi:hypothetical protein